MGPVTLDPCDLCPLFPQGHDVPPFPPSCLDCSIFREVLASKSQAVDHPQTQ